MASPEAHLDGAGQEHDLRAQVRRQILGKRRKLAIVLLCQDLCGRHHGALEARPGCPQQRQERNRRLAGTHVALQHRKWSADLSAELADGRLASRVRSRNLARNRNLQPPQKPAQAGIHLQEAHHWGGAPHIADDFIQGALLRRGQLERERSTAGIRHFPVTHASALDIRLALRRAAGSYRP